MIFLIQYDRTLGRIVELQTFDDEHRAAADTARFALELANARTGSLIEVVLLDAESEEALRKTHRRYFETLEQLTEPVTAGR